MIENQKTYHVTVLNEISMIDKDPYLEGERKQVRSDWKKAAQNSNFYMHEENAKYLITVNYNLIAN